MNTLLSPQHWKDQLANSAKQISHIQTESISGRIVKVTGLVMEAVGIKLPVGSACQIHLPNDVKIEAEVVGFDGDRLFLMPQSDLDGVVPGAAVVPVASALHQDPNQPHRRTNDRTKRLPVGYELLGRVLDANGRPLDTLGPLNNSARAALGASIYN